MDFDDTIESWIRNDALRMDALQLASTLGLKDWCIAAGFVRNLVWDHLHGKQQPTALNDIDLIYFDPDVTSADADERLETRLTRLRQLPWSVKNQARMHIRNNDQPYASTTEAMSYWVEMETAVAVRLSDRGQFELLAPFGLAKLFEYSITLNRKRSKPQAFRDRIERKGWLSLWPKLQVIDQFD